MRIKYLLLLGLLFLFSDCQKDHLSFQEETAVFEKTSNNISGDDARDVVNYLDGIINSESLKLGKINLPFDKKLIDKKTIAKINDRKTGYTNFTFAVKRKRKDNFLFQVVVTKYGKNDFSEPYIFQLRFDNDFRRKLNKKEHDWRNYNGPLHPYSLNGAAEALSKDLPCPVINPGNTPGNTIDSGNNLPAHPAGTDEPGGSDGSEDGSNGGSQGPSNDCGYAYFTTYDIDGNIVEIEIKYICNTPSQNFYENDDCHDPPEAPIGFIEPEEEVQPLAIEDMTNIQKAEHLQTQINQNRPYASFESLKNDDWFINLIAKIIPRPDGIPNYLWKKMAIKIYAGEFAATIAQYGTSSIPLGTHGYTVSKLLATNVAAKFLAFSNTIINSYEEVKNNLPTTPQGWTDLGVATSGVLAYELAGILNPAVGAAQSLESAWQAMDDGNKVIAAGLVLAAIAEFVPWTKLTKTVVKVGDILSTMVKLVANGTFTKVAGLAISKNLGAMKALARPFGTRPDPSTYLKADFIANHLSKFDDGAVRFTTKNKIDSHGTLGSPEAFTMPKSEFDDLIAQTGGNMSQIENALGLETGLLVSDDAVIAWIKKEDFTDLKIPSGNEGGVNANWIPGGVTTGGVSEAVLDLSNPNLPYTTYPF